MIKKKKDVLRFPPRVSSRCAETFCSWVWLTRRSRVKSSTCAPSPSSQVSLFKCLFIVGGKNNNTATSVRVSILKMLSGKTSCFFTGMSFLLILRGVSRGGLPVHSRGAADFEGRVRQPPAQAQQERPVSGTRGRWDHCCSGRGCQHLPEDHRASGSPSQEGPGGGKTGTSTSGLPSVSSTLSSDTPCLFISCLRPAV